MRDSEGWGNGQTEMGEYGKGEKSQTESQILFGSTEVNVKYTQSALVEHYCIAYDVTNT